jgi:hypothetical protein
MIKTIIPEALSQKIGLAKTQIGQRWVDDTFAILHPFGLSMANKNKFHHDNLV